ncbi:hypothetical protein BD410DRAFT_837318 [Rickenella mellea]|uniref:Nephrocystin 3-like N-terminal domain-containing protein n=1 Tax=Rickenella mellea TaxID=50990 RepID=A0A4Y7QFK6_9AGAM|nr:hypothetical protein BD410DRAFT_837318 [Rickenella mellea]
MALPSGEYIIANVRTRNRAAFSNSDDHTDLLSSSGNHATFRDKWLIEPFPNGQYTIINKDYNSMAICDHRPRTGSHVFGVRVPESGAANKPHYLWDIRSTGVPHVYTVCKPASANLCWKAELEHGSTITLAEYRRDDSFHWTFNFNPAELKPAVGGVNLTEDERKKAEERFDKFCENRVPGAAFDSQQHDPASKCLPGTRIAVREKIAQWRDDHEAPPIFWLKGPAGAGKTSIARTIAEECRESGNLAGSFFFRRGLAGCTDITGFVPTVSSQLTVNVPLSLNLVYKAIHDDHFIFDKSRQDQFKKLIVNTLYQLEDVVTPKVLIVDALDECDTKSAVEELVNILSDVHFPLRVFVTSRGEGYIQEIFNHPNIEERTCCLPLEDPDLEPSGDIYKFLKNQFSAISFMKRHLIKQPWPSEADLQNLVKLSEGLFIYASTVVRLVEGDTYPPDRLKNVLSLPKSPLAGLDCLYAQILASAITSPEFKQVVGTIVLTRKPLSVNELQHLLQLERHAVLNALHGLHSVLMISNDDDAPIQPFHKSLYDHLTDENRSGAAAFIDPTVHAIRITLACLKSMLADMQYATSHRPDWKKSYACHNWFYHLADALIHKNLSQEDYHNFTDCLTNFFVYAWNPWIEHFKFQSDLGTVDRLPAEQKSVGSSI